MPIRFESVVDYGGTKVKVTADSFPELHEALARIAELDKDAAFLASKGAENVVPSYRRDKEENDYYGFTDPATGRDVTFGRMKDKSAVVPFFPKGEEGFYDPAVGRQNGPPTHEQYRLRSAARRPEGY